MTTKKSPWNWIPTLYFAEGLPYVAVMTLSVIMYKRLVDLDHAGTNRWRNGRNRICLAR